MGISLVGSVFCRDTDHIWEEVSFVELKSGDLLVMEHSPLLGLLLLLRSESGRLLDTASFALMLWEIMSGLRLLSPFQSG